MKSCRASYRWCGGGLPFRWLLGASMWVSALLGCSRQLPGPAECQQLSAAILGISDANQLRDPRVKLEFDKLTRDCLLTPFDRELIQCIDESARARYCLHQFQQRRQRLERNDGFGGPVRRW